jgi:HEAT repeat protein
MGSIRCGRHGNSCILLSGNRSRVTFICLGTVESVKQAATLALAELELSPATLTLIAAKLSQVFQSGDHTLQNAAATALAVIVEKSGAISLVQAALSNAKTRAMAIQVAERLGAKAAPVVPQLTTALGDENANMRREAAMALAAVGSLAAEATPQLVERIKDESLEVQWAAAYALGSIGEKAAASVGALAEATRNGSDSVRPIAAWALAHVAPSDLLTMSVAVPALAKSLRSNRVEERVRAANGLETAGETAISALNALKYAQQDPSPVVRGTVANALKAVQR